MADKNENNGDASTKSSDATFMMECLKHLQNPAAVDIDAVAAALEYKNSASVANRVRALKKKFDLQVTCTHGAVNANGSNGSPAKGAKAARGPVKAKAEPTDAEGEEAKAGATKTPKKPGRKAAPKSKKTKGAAAASDEAAKTESATVQDEDDV